MTDPGLPYWPAAMNQKMAAAYCGLSVDLFKRLCPVQPIAFTDSAWGHRYLRQRLDEWLLSLDPNGGNAIPKILSEDERFSPDRGAETFETLIEWQEWRERQPDRIQPSPQSGRTKGKRPL